MDRDFWRRAIKKWFSPFDMERANNHNECPEMYYGGNKTEDEVTEYDKSKLRGIRVWVRGTRTKDHGEENMHSFYGKLLVINDDDQLVLLDAKRVPTLIPWGEIRYIEVV